MSEDKKITVKIDRLGNPKIEAHGFNGQGCTDATKAIETALAGGKGIDVREYKGEFYQAEAETQTLHW